MSLMCKTARNFGPIQYSGYDMILIQLDKYSGIFLNTFSHYLSLQSTKEACPDPTLNGIGMRSSTSLYHYIFAHIQMDLEEMTATSPPFRNQFLYHISITIPIWLTY